MHDTALTWAPYPRPHKQPSIFELFCDGLRGRFAGTASCLSAGSFHSVFLDTSGTVLTCGSAGTDDADEDESAMLGHGDLREMVRPTAVKQDRVMEPAPRFVAVAASPMCTLAIAETGEVYSCGSGASGTLGHGGVADKRTLSRISILKHSLVVADPIVAVACGLQHCLALSQHGVVRSWGRGDTGA